MDWIIYHWSLVKYAELLSNRDTVNLIDEFFGAIPFSKCKQVKAYFQTEKFCLFDGSNFWSVKGFESIQYHVLDFLRRCNFGPKFQKVDQKFDLTILALSFLTINVFQTGKKYKNRHESIPWKYFEISSIMIVLTDVVFSALANESVPLQ